MRQLFAIFLTLTLFSLNAFAEIECSGGLENDETIIVKSKNNISSVDVFFVNNAGAKTGRSFEFSKLKFERYLGKEVLSGEDVRREWTHFLTLAVSSGNPSYVTLKVAHGWTWIVHDTYQYKINCK